MQGRTQYDDDNWSNGGVIVDAGLVNRIKLAEPFCESHVTTTSAADAFQIVLADVDSLVAAHAN